MPTLRVHVSAIALATLSALSGCALPAAPAPSDEALPDFSLMDVNAESARFQQEVSPRDYLGDVSAWYFGHSTWGYCRSQFGFLNTMQTEIDAETTARPVHILGINDIGLESGNDGMTFGRTLPWLQPGADQDIWSLWNVTYRDVIILGPGNEHVGTFNLTVHDLADPAEYEALKSQLLQAANQ